MFDDVYIITKIRLKLWVKSDISHSEHVFVKHGLASTQNWRWLYKYRCLDTKGASIKIMKW